MPFLVIDIPWSPNIGHLGPFLITWHGFFTAVGILAGVQLALWAGRRVGYDEDDAYTLALVGVPSGIIGARLMFVLEHWSYYSASPGEVLAITEGGISIWGAVIGGVLGALFFALWKRYVIARGLDIAGIGLILGMAIGRIGDLINGEHLARPSDLPWAVLYTNPHSPGFAHSLTVGAVHPATTYELIGDLVILGVAIWLLLGPLRRRPGLTFFWFFIGYAVMRFFLTYLRVDSAPTLVPGLRVPQLVSVICVLVAIPFLVYFLRRPPEDDAETPLPPGRVPVQPARSRR